MSAFNLNIMKAIKSFAYAFNGIRQVVRLENNFRIHLLAAAVVTMAGWYVNITNLEWLWLLLFIGLVLVAETFNAAIEKLVDMVSPDKNPKAGLVKDLAAGAVLIAATVAAIGGVIIFWKYFTTIC